MQHESPQVPYAVHVDVVAASAPQYPLPDIIPPSQQLSEWEIGLCDCCSAPAHFCMALFFPCINGAYVARSIEKPVALVAIMLLGTYYASMYTEYSARTYKVVDQVTNTTSLIYYGGSSGDNMNEYDDSSFTVFLLFILIVGYLRRAFRQFHVLPGSIIEDCCYSFWCSCCALSQMSAHTQRAKDKQAAATLPAYTAA